VSKLTIRASSVPHALLCPGSLRTADDAVKMNVGGELANLGTAGHFGAQDLVEHGSVHWESLPAVATRFGVEENELRAISGLATKLWRSELPTGGLLSDTFPNALTEVDLRHESDKLVVTGHADIVSIGGSIGRIGDWKFGFRDSDPKAQLQTYAALLLLDNPELTSATATILWVREQQIENYTMGQEGARAWFERLEDRLANWDGVYRVGPHCEHCPRRHCCPAGMELARRDVRCFLDTSAEDHIALMQPDELINTLDMARRVGRYAEACAKAIKAHIVTNGDVTGTDRVATIVHEPRRALVPLAAFPVLQEFGFADEDMAAVMRLSIGRAEDIVAARAPKRGGAAAKRQLAARLEAACAIEETHVDKLVIRRI
jgi:hypothetical protein